MAKPRRLVQIIHVPVDMVSSMFPFKKTIQHSMAGLCDDGSLWLMAPGQKWKWIKLKTPPKYGPKNPKT